MPYSDTPAKCKPDVTSSPLLCAIFLIFRCYHSSWAVCPSVWPGRSRLHSRPRSVESVCPDGLRRQARPAVVLAPQRESPLVQGASLLRVRAVELVYQTCHLTVLLILLYVVTAFIITSQRCLFSREPACGQSLNVTRLYIAVTGGLRRCMRLCPRRRRQMTYT